MHLLWLRKSQQEAKLFFLKNITFWCQNSGCAPGRTLFCMIQKSINRINKTEMKKKSEGCRLNVRKYFLVCESLPLQSRSTRRCSRLQSQAFTTSLGRLSLEVLKTKLNSALVNMLQGITLCWARYGQDQLTDLFYVYFLLFLTVGKRTLLEKSLKPPSTPCLFFFKDNRLSGIAGSALLITAATSLPPVLLCSPSIPTLIEKPWKELPGEKRKGGKKI